MEARCTACKVYGGADEPCMGEGERGAYLLEHGRPCPRVVLDNDNVEAWELLQLAMNEPTGRLLGTMVGELLLEDLFAGMTHDQAKTVAHRAAGAMQDGRVWRALFPPPKKEGR